jgi:hypothetical protein
MGRGGGEIYFKYLPIDQKTNNLFFLVDFTEIFIHGYRFNRQETAELAAGGRQHQHLGTGRQAAHLTVSLLATH